MLLLSNGDELERTVFLITFEMTEQFPNDAEFRTFGDAVIFNGTVHDALNDAERCT